MRGRVPCKIPVSTAKRDSIVRLPHIQHSGRPGSLKYKKCASTCNDDSNSNRKHTQVIEDILTECEQLRNSSRILSSSLPRHNHFGALAETVRHIGQANKTNVSASRYKSYLATLKSNEKTDAQLVRDAVNMMEEMKNSPKALKSSIWKISQYSPKMKRLHHY